MITEHNFAFHLHTAQQMRALDRSAIESADMAGYLLMSRAGARAWVHISRRWVNITKMLVLCGGGNNGGDGFIVARLAHIDGVKVTAITTQAPDQLHGDARRAYMDFMAVGGACRSTDNILRLCDEEKPDVIVDALLGTGLKSAVSGVYRQWIESLAENTIPVAAMDIPSGICADTGSIMGCAIKAALTVTFVGHKRGLFTGQAPEYTGQLIMEDLGIPSSVQQAHPRWGYLMNQPLACKLLPPRSRCAHKGMFGYVVLVGGDAGMPGAIRMAAEAALRTGAGRVSVVTHPSHAATINVMRPEMMCQATPSVNEIQSIIKKANIIALGPGLGRLPWGEQWYHATITAAQALVVDADGLYWLATQPSHRNDWVLTPHSGEAARLLGCTAAEVEQDRFSAAAELQQRYGGTIVLKGAGSIIQSGHTAALVPAANPGMASGGMGDVLTGIIAGLLAQGLSQHDAAMLGVWLHAAAARRACASLERGMLATDIMMALHQEVNPRTLDEPDACIL